MLTSLHVPDASAWRRDAGYSPALAGALLAAYTLLIRGSSAEAKASLAPFSALPMSDRQRVRVHFVLGLAHLALGELPDAQACLDEALNISFRLTDLRACAELSYLQATVMSETQKYASALTYLLVARDTFSTAHDADPGDTTDLAFECNLFAKLASQSFLAGQFEDCDHYLTLAKAPVRDLPSGAESALCAAELDWTTALLERWRGAAPAAVVHAKKALEMYDAIGSPGAAARLRIVLADCLLDSALADTAQPDGSSRDVSSTLARAHLDVALAHLGGTADPAGEGMALLAYARSSRMLQLNEDRLILIEGVAHDAERLADLPLLGQAYTAIGDEFSARGEAELAANCYRRALGVIEKSDVVSLARWPRRALLIWNEWHE